jgi:hypothetical protein
VSNAALASVVASSFGAIKPASELAGHAADSATRRVLPVVPELGALLPDGGLRAGSTINVGGSRSLLLALLAATTQRQGWAAVVGIPDLGALAAAELGVHLDRLALIPRPGTEAADVVAALIDGVAIVVVNSDSVLPAGSRGLSLARRLSARARNRGAVLLPVGDWPAPDLQLWCGQARWIGLGAGHGRLADLEITVDVRGRGGASRPTRSRLRFPLGASSPLPAGTERDTTTG